jgi:hypothetical protein
MGLKSSDFSPGVLEAMEARAKARGRVDILLEPAPVPPPPTPRLDVVLARAERMMRRATSLCYRCR